MTASDSLKARIEALPLWRGEVALTPLKGGLSNLSFIAEDESGRYVVRCGGDIPVHHVFRDRESAASAAAFAAGLSPELIHAEPGLMVLRHIAGHTFTEADMRARIGGIVPLLQRTHRDMKRHVRGPANVFWVFHVIRDYTLTLAKGGHDPQDLARWRAIADRLEEAQTPLPIVFGHHDFLPGNFIADDQRIWLIDWEYGGFSTCMFDLANIAANGSFSPDEERRLLEAYFETHPPESVIRAFDAMKAASALREATWAMVSALHLAAPGADYAAHAADYLARTAAALDRFSERYGPS